MNWTLADVTRANQEGWKLSSNQVPTPIYNSNGVPYFKNIYAVCDFIRKKATTSEWHRDIYLNLQWSAYDHYTSLSEGWKVFPGGIGTTRLSSFPSDEIAKQHVQTQAQNGDVLCIKALAHIIKSKLLTQGQQYHGNGPS